MDIDVILDTYSNFCMSYSLYVSYRKYIHTIPAFSTPLFCHFLLQYKCLQSKF